MDNDTAIEVAKQIIQKAGFAVLSTINQRRISRSRAYVKSQRSILKILIFFL